MGKLTTLVGKFSARGKDKGRVLEQPDGRESTPPREEQQKAEGSGGPYTGRNGRHALGPELSEESERGEGAHDVAAFGSDVSTEFKREAPNTYSGELDGLVVTRPTFQSMVFQRPKNAAGDSKACASCRREADPRHPGSLFTAECGHTFHFEWIALGLDLGQLRCPLCRKTWRRLPDTGAWANGALGYSYQGQPLNRKGAGARPPRSSRPSNTPPPPPLDDDVDLDDIPVAPVIHPSDPNQAPGSGPLALERPPTFRDMTETGTGPSEGPPASAFKGSWAKRTLRLDADEYEAEQSPGDPFHFHHSERFSEASPGVLDDLPSPVALQRGGDFAKRKEGGGAPAPEFDFGVLAKSDAQERSQNPPEAAPALDTGGVNIPVQPPVLKVNKPGSAPVPGPQAPPIFARRRRTSKDSAPLPSIIEAASPDKKSIHLKPPPGRKTPPISPRRRYERRQAANSEDTGPAPKLVANPLEGKRRSQSLDGENRASGEGLRGVGSLTPPPGRGSLTPPPGRGGRPAASKLDDQDWAHFFAPSREFKPTGALLESSGSDEESPPARGLAEAPRFRGEPPSKAPQDLTASVGRGRKAPDVEEPVTGDEMWNQSAEILSGRVLPPDHPLFASYSKAFKVLDGNPPVEAGVYKSPVTSRPGSLSPEPGRGSPSPAKESSPSREFPEHLESFRVSVPPADGTWSSVDEHERDIRVDTNSNIVYSRSTDRTHAAGERPHAADERPNPIADSRGWFYNSDFGSDGISEVLRGVQAQKGVNQPEAWNQASGHQFGGSLQADGGFDMARFEAAIGPEMFDDDDPVTPLQPIPGSAPDLEISVRSEHPAVAAADSRDKFLCLVTVKAAPLVKTPASNPSSSNQSPPGATSHHSRKASGSGRSFDSDVGTSGVPSRKRAGSRGSAELDGLDWPRNAGDRLQRAGSADVAPLQPLERRDSADLDGWLTDQMTERLRLSESVCPAPEALPGPDPHALEEARAPLDLVAVLDVSKSMMGRKLRLVQKTIEFVTQNLGPNDRLSVVAFSKRAYRVTPLLRVTGGGRERIVSAVKRIEVSSGTNIGAGLRLGLKVLKDARTRNPVRAVVLLSDGQDSWGRREMSLLLPEWGVTDWAGVAVHTFGFGGDHDAEAMFSVASEAKGTYSFIKKTEGVQDAFARCIGGLLTVVAQDVTLSLQVGGGNGDGNGCRIQHLHAGMFERTVDEAGTRAEIVLGDMYAEEARDILVELNLPKFTGSSGADERQLVLATSGNYVQARTQLIKAITPAELVVSRPLQIPPGEALVDIDVDRQRNRLIATRAMSTAREWAELGQLGAAQKMLENAIAQIGQSAAFAGGDPLTLQLDNDLRECAVGFASMDEYEERGRAFSMSQGLSHTMQRASTSSFRRGSRTGSAGYSTSTMEFMINRSQCFEVKR